MAGLSEARELTDQTTADATMGVAKANIDTLNFLFGAQRLLFAEFLFASNEMLETIEQHNAELATAIRNQMFVFEDFLEIPETGLRELLGQIDKKQLATALKGASEDLRNHFFKCMSSRAVEMLKEDMEALGPLRARDVQSGQQEIVSLARRLESDGKLVLKSDGEESYVL